MARRLAVLAGLLAVSGAQADDIEKFEEFISKYKKNYSEAEHERRFSAFQKNLKRIPELSAQEGDDGAKFTYLTPFADLDPHEYHGYTGSANGAACQWSEKYGPGPILQPTATPRHTLDYVTEGAVTPVKNQGDCPSCWAHGAIAVVEGRLKLDTGKLTSLSEQWLLDCDKDRVLKGCSGGIPERAMSWLVHSGAGVPSSADYPYTQANEKCKKGVTPVAHVVSFGVVGGDGTPKSVASALTQYGPIATAMDFNMVHLYKSGILTNPLCGVANHVMTFVGYGTENGVDYWKIKNSWGTDFGEEGYWRLIRNPTGKCNPGVGGCQIIASKVAPGAGDASTSLNAATITV